MTMFNKSWKTSLFGLLAALCIAEKPVYDTLSSGGPINWHALLSAAGAAAFVAVMGWAARDKNVSTEQQAGVSPALIAACKDAGIKP